MLAPAPPEDEASDPPTAESGASPEDEAASDPPTGESGPSPPSSSRSGDSSE